MSVLAEIYVSNDEEAVGYDRNSDRFRDRAEHKGFTYLELSTLWAIMRGVPWDVAVLDQFPCLLQQDDGERFIHRLPAAMVADLVNLTPERTAAVASEWAATEELCWPRDAAVRVIEALVRLARRASETRREVYLWNCV